MSKTTLLDIFTITKPEWLGTRGEITAVRNAMDIISFLGGSDRLVSTIDYKELSGVCLEMSKAGLSNATINRKLSALSKMFTMATKHGLMLSVPGIPFRKESNKKIRWITPHEERLMYQFCETGGTYQLQVFFEFMIDTGLRLSEAIDLVWEHIDLNKQILTIWESKNDQPRTVPLTLRATHGLLRLNALQAGSSGPFTSFSVSRIQHVWAALRSYMGLLDDPLFTPHVMRHTCASRLVSGGADLLVVKEWLGHRSLNTTLRYAHLNPKRLRDAVAILEQP